MINEGEPSVSKGKTFIALTVATFVALVIVGVAMNHHTSGDPTGTATGGLSDYLRCRRRAGRYH